MVSRLPIFCNYHESFLDRKTGISNTPMAIISPAKRRDHLHLLKRRKSRARLLNQEERAKLLHFRKFFIHSTPPHTDNGAVGYQPERKKSGIPRNITQHEFIRRVEFLRRELLSEVTHDEEGTKMTAKELVAAKAAAAGQGKPISVAGGKYSKIRGFR